MSVYVFTQSLPKGQNIIESIFLSGIKWVEFRGFLFLNCLNKAKNSVYNENRGEQGISEK